MKKNYIPYIILALFGLLLFTMAITNHYLFRTVTYDYGNYNFAFWDYSHFKISPITTSEGNYLQDHFSLTLMFFVPIYWLFNWITGTYTLLIIQYILILIAGWCTYKLVLLKSNSIILSSLALVYYFVLLGRYTTFSCDCNLAVLSSCFVPVFLYFFYRRNYFVSFLILIISLFSRENIPIWFIFIFVFLIIEFRKDKKAVLYSIGGVLVSVVYFVLLFRVFIPGVESEERQFTLFNYSALGENPGEAFMFTLTHPFQTIKMFFVNHLGDPSSDGIKAEFYFVYLVSGGIVAFFRPKYLIWLIPVVAQKMLNDSIVRWGISTYYSIELVTLLPLSVFLTLSEFKNQNLKIITGVVACVAAVTITLYKLNPDNVKLNWTTNPSKERIYDRNFFKKPFNVKKVNMLLKEIPQDAKVSSSDRILPHLAQRQFIYMFPDVKDAEYLIFSVFDDNFMYSQKENDSYRMQYLTNPEWMVVADEFPVLLLKRRESGMADRFGYNKKWLPDTLGCNFENIDTIQGKVLFHDNSIADSGSKLSDLYARSGRFSLKLIEPDPYGISLYLPEINTCQRFSVEAWYYGGESVHTNLVACCGDEFYLGSNTVEQTDSLGWKKIELSFWLKPFKNPENFKVYLWNNSTVPVYFDDFKLTRWRVKPD